jgi:hypothetical protein
MLFKRIIGVFVINNFSLKTKRPRDISTFIAGSILHLLASFQYSLKDR